MDPQPQPQSTEKTPSLNDSAGTGTAQEHQEHHGPPPRSHTIDVIEHRIDTGFRSIENFRRRRRKTTYGSTPEWFPPNQPYREYVRNLVAAGWNNLQGLDTYLAEGHAQQNDLIISVLDISNQTINPWPEIHSEHELQTFFDTHPREVNSIRLYLAEYSTSPSAALIEILGAQFKLDPRFFQWSIHSQGHVFTPSQRHRAPYINLGFAVLNTSTPRGTDAERFKVLVYINPEQNGWTGTSILTIMNPADVLGIILFSSHTKINLSARILTDPPSFGAPKPPPKTCDPKSVRELYIDSVGYLDLSMSSPFYIVSPLLKLDCFFWNQIITAIREEDHRIQGISDTSVGHAEEIKKTLDVVGRGGSLGWPDGPGTKESQSALEEDFKHLVDQTQLLWDTRDKMASIKEKNSEARWTTLTNAFTYIFAPVTIMTGIYGMNVSQISGDSSNPNIWQFFVAVAVFNVVALLVLSLSAWIQIQLKHGRAAGLGEVLGMALGRSGK